MTWPELDLYRLFLLTSFIVLIIPGPAVIYIMTTSVDQGRVAGVVSALGLGIGNLVQALAAALGLSALVASSAIAFSIVKYAGAAYLIYVGVRRLMQNDDPLDMTGRQRRLPKIFTQGIVVNILNPKVALFFLAFLPQFIDTTRGGVTSQVAILGCSFAVLGVFTDSTYGLIGGTIGGALKQSLRYKKAERYVTGGIFITLGVGSALAGSHTKTSA
jgi:threonine/homoserine/homoserine lactone efflux protein